MPIDVTLPMTEEIRMDIRQMNSGKAEESDNIPVEALKSDLKATESLLHVLFRKILKEEKVPPTAWEEGYLIKITKRGDLSKYENFRGITLPSVPGEVFNRVLLNWMRDSVDAQLRDQQAGIHTTYCTAKSFVEDT
ncbi:unnamed protein product [Schistosoma curassoni]|uniref:Reverse transcriptase domain-containing protein n=1 Tax=Schistosoma curassoni TaxID=6186 RepID=A0A183KLU2_9TREM|nr:unnamed protein product [Schistosoma curassoni]